MNQLLDEIDKKGSVNQNSSVFINGQVLVDPTSPRVCPLSISVSGDESYYIYMDSLTKWNDDISFMVEANKTVSLDVPIGRYELYCASGNIWHGQSNKFGPNTQYYKADSNLEFTSDGEYNYGYMVELSGSSGGNIKRHTVDSSEFPG